MNLLRLGETFLVSVKNTDVVENCGDIGMIWPERAFIKLKRARVLGFGLSCSPDFAEGKRDVVQNGT